MNLGQKHHFALTTALAASTALVTLGLSGGTASASLCTPTGYYWNGSVTLNTNNPVLHTGIVLPAPLENQELKINQVTYSAFDNSEEASRLDPPEQDERFGITVGGVAVGGLSADLPDDESSAYATGTQTGSLGATGAHSNGGELVFHHASTYGYSGFNSFTISAVSVYVVNCAEPAPTTSEPAPTTSEPAPTTTVDTTPVDTAPVVEVPVVEVGPPPTPPTTIVVNEVKAPEPQPTVTSVAPIVVDAAPKVLAVSPAVRQPLAIKALPATGGQSGAISLVALFSTLTGAALLYVRRRPMQA